MGKIQFPSTQNADFRVDDVTDPNGSPGRVLDLDLGFTVKGHIDFPSWMSGTANVSIYADQHGGGYNQKILDRFHHRGDWNRTNSPDYRLAGGLSH